jgi:hypothetical protein
MNEPHDYSMKRYLQEVHQIDITGMSLVEMTKVKIEHYAGWAAWMQTEAARFIAEAKNDVRDEIPF